MTELRKNRAIKCAHYILETHSNMTDTAKVMGISVSTVSQAINRDLKEIDNELYKEVRDLCDEILFNQRQASGLKGGEATKKKYKGKKRVTSYKPEVAERAVMFAKYIVENKATLKETANKFNYSITLVYQDVSEKLSIIDKSLYRRVKYAINKNKQKRGPK